MNETVVRALLTELADETPSGTSVDSYRAVGTAVRRRRQQRHRVIGGAAAVVALVLIFAAVAVNATRHEEKAAPVLQPGGSPLFDPRTSVLDPGWLPTERTIRLRHTVDPLRECLTTPRTRTCLQIRGYEPSPSVPWGNSEHGPYISGFQSRWFPYEFGDGTGNEGGELWWQYAHDSWATVQISYMPNGRAVAERIAETLEVAPAARVKLPFRLRPEPTGKVASTDVVTNADGQSATVRYDDPTGSSTVQVRSVAESSVVEPTSTVGRWQVRERPLKGGTTHLEFKTSPTALVTVEGDRVAVLAAAAAVEPTADPARPDTWK